MFIITKGKDVECLPPPLPVPVMFGVHIVDSVFQIPIIHIVILLLGVTGPARSLLPTLKWILCPSLDRQCPIGCHWPYMETLDQWFSNFWGTPLPQPQKQTLT